MSAKKIATDCDKCAEYYEERPGHSTGLTTADLYRAIARLARIVETLTNENDALRAQSR